MRGIVVDNFAGGGGASTGIEAALGRPIDYAINHDREAIEMHKANHPHTHHLCGSVFDYAPRSLTRGRHVALGWFSPDCTFHSKARGGKPFRDRHIARRRRGLAGVVVRWAKEARPNVVMLENVEEFAAWGPLLKSGVPDPRRRGSSFRHWVRQLENLGYRVDMRELRACDYGAPTTRKRLFVIARCDGEEIVFPEESHGPGLVPYRTAADCIDFDRHCPSIFERERPLVPATMRRIARGVMRYVVNSHDPFVVTMRGTDESHIDTSASSIHEPLRTISAAGTHHALVTPFIAGLAHGDHKERAGGRCRGVDQPIGTIHAGGNNFALVTPFVVNTRNGERAGQAPRVRDIRDPLPTVTAAGSQGAIAMAFLARHYGGHENDGSSLRAPMHTITTKDHHALVTAFLLKYYGADQDPRIGEPLHTITSKDRFGLVMVRGEPHRIVDIGMRMLTPRELFRAQSFPGNYIIDPVIDGDRLTKTAQVRMCGNSVPPVIAEALVRANVVEQSEERAA